MKTEEPIILTFFSSFAHSNRFDGVYCACTPFYELSKKEDPGAKRLFITWLSHDSSYERKFVKFMLSHLSRALSSPICNYAYHARKIVYQELGIECSSSSVMTARTASMKDHESFQEQIQTETPLLNWSVAPFTKIDQRWRYTANFQHILFG